MAGINRTTGKATDLITFSRASGGTALRKISYGSELVTNGDFETALGAEWVAYRSVISIVSNKLRVESNEVRTVNFASQSFAVETGKVYRFTADISDITASAVRLFVGPADRSAAWGATSNITTDGTYELIFTATGTTAYISLVLTSVVDASVEHADFDNISVKEVLFDQPDGTLTLFNHPDDIPRIEYAADGSVKGLLIEEQRTNLVTYSEAFDNAAWSVDDIDVSPNEAVSPSGEVTMDLLTETAVNSRHIIFRPVSIDGSNTFTISSFVKNASGSRYVFIRLAQNDGFGAIFDLSTGQATDEYNIGSGSVLSGSASITDVGNSTYRISVSGTCNANVAEYFVIGLSNVSTYASATLESGDPKYLGDGTSGIYLWGAQLEAGSFPTSYIPTSGATATRAADIASISVDNFGYNQKAGTVVVDVDYYNTGSINSSILIGSSNDRYFLYYSGGWNYQVRDGGTTVAQLAGPANSLNDVVAFAWKENDFIIQDGSGNDTDNSGTLPLTSGLTLYLTGAFGFKSNGHIKSIQYYPRRLTNAQLQELTS